MQRMDIAVQGDAYIHIGIFASSLFCRLRLSKRRTLGKAKPGDIQR